MKICVIVTNYNGHRFLSAHLGKLRKQCEKHNVPLIVSDNGSSDESIAYLNAHRYTYTINTKTEPKQGFAGNVNNGIRFAQSRDTFDYYVIASNDIAVADHFFSALLKALEFLHDQELKHGLVGFDEVLPEQAASVRDFDYDHYDPVSMKKTNEIPGFIFVIHQSLIDSIGGMDEEYFMYGEDTDYYTRASKAGFGIYNTMIPVLHFSEGSSTNSKQTSWLVYRNAFLFAQKNLDMPGRLKMLASFINQIYNPFHKSANASHMRVKRNGFFYNNYLLAKSLLWNFRYYLNKRKN